MRSTCRSLLVELLQYQVPPLTVVPVKADRLSKLQGKGLLALMPREVHHHAMTVLFLVGGLLALLALWCWCEARSGKPACGAHLSPDGLTTHDASKSAKGSLAATLGTAAVMGVDGGDG